MTTFDHQGNDNGFLIEIFKDGDKTSAYLSAAYPGAFKGYHLHRVRAARYICLRGRMRIILYVPHEANGKTTWVREEHLLEAGEPKRALYPEERWPPAYRTSATRTGGSSTTRTRRTIRS